MQQALKPKAIDAWTIGCTDWLQQLQQMQPVKRFKVKHKWEKHKWESSFSFVLYFEAFDCLHLLQLLQSICVASSPGSCSFRFLVLVALFT